MKVTAEAVKALRKRTGWSTYDLAAEVGCNQSTIWRIEAGAKFGGVIEKAIARLISENPPPSHNSEARAA